MATICSFVGDFYLDRDKNIMLWTLTKILMMKEKTVFSYKDNVKTMCMCTNL